MVDNQRFEETFNKVNNEYSNYFETKKVKVLDERKKAAAVTVAFVVLFIFCVIIPFMLILFFAVIIGFAIYSVIKYNKDRVGNNQIANKPSE